MLELVVWWLNWYVMFFYFGTSMWCLSCAILWWNWYVMCDVACLSFKIFTAVCLTTMHCFYFLTNDILSQFTRIVHPFPTYHHITYHSFLSVCIKYLHHVTSSNFQHEGIVSCSGTSLEWVFFWTAERLWFGVPEGLEAFSKREVRRSFCGPEIYC